MEISKNDLKFFSLAKNQALLSDYPRCHTGCIVVYKNKIISQGYNCNKTHPLQQQLNKYRFTENSIPKLHAEIYALLSLLNYDIDWNKVKLYIYRIATYDRIETTGLARPCSSCLHLINKLGIHHIFYTTKNGYAYEYMI